MKKLNSLLLSFIVLITISNPSNAQGLLDGFTPKKGDLSITASYTNSTYDEFYAGTEKVDVTETEQNIISLYAKYGISDRFSVILNVPYINAERNDGTPDPINGETSLSEFQDISVALKFNAAKFSFKGGNLNIITALTTHIPTGYEPNGILSNGNGTFGVDYTAGLHLNTNVGFFSTLLASYNLRDDAENNFLPGGEDFNVPNSFALSGKIGYASNFIYVEAWAHHINAVDGIDISSPDFIGNLPETNVDYGSVGITVYKNILPYLGISASYGTVVNGRNVSLYENFSAGITYNFNHTKVKP